VKPQEDNGYTGIENLDVMAEAKNYNTYLANLVCNNQEPGHELVDFGAGTGTFAQMMVDRGYKVICIEPDIALSERLSAAGLSVYGSIQQVDKIESLYSLNVLEHIEDDFSTVVNLFGQMKINGKILIYVPAFMVLFTSMDKRVGHFRRYTKKQLIELFEQAGFVVDDARYADSLGFFVTLLFKWFGSNTGEINLRALKIYDTFVFPLSRFCDFLFSPFFGKNVMLRARKTRA